MCGPESLHHERLVLSMTRVTAFALLAYLGATLTCALLLVALNAQLRHLDNK